MQRANLVVHQCNQRRHHNRYAVARVLPCNRRDLVTQRLAAAGGHQHQSVASINYMLNDGCLWPTKIGVAEDLAQDVQRGGLINQFGQFKILFAID